MVYGCFIHFKFKNKQLDFKKYSQLIDAFNTSPSIEKCSQVRELLANSESAIRSYASESLAHYYYYTKNKKEFLELFGHSTPDVRLGALNALSKLENIPIEYDCLSRLFTDATDSVKSKAWSILAERTIKQLRNGNDEASIFLSKLLSHKDPLIKLAAELTVQRVAGEFKV